MAGPLAGLAEVNHPVLPVSQRLILFTRWPRPGQTKTRLIPALGSTGAAEVQLRLTERTLATCRELLRRMPVRLELRGEGAYQAAFRRWLGLAPLIRPQAPVDLGLRMDLALRTALAEGEQRVVLIGSDCPGLTPDILEQAFAALAGHDLVLGPALDGGYYLVGLTRPAPGLFQDIAWGTDRVLGQTLRKAEELGLKAALLPELADLDRPEDLPLLDSAPPLPPRPPAPEVISVVIPALNEASHLPAAIASAAGPGVEVIVVDGGSRDQTLAIARQAGTLALASFRGRARQQNLGAALARGGVLLFLHADSRLPAGWQAEVRRVLADPGAALGCFRFALDQPLPGARLLEAMVHLRTRFLSLPYGDQALFLPAGIFAALGGFAELPIMEDYDLVRRAGRLGRVVQARLTAPTSGRRWRTLGVTRTTIVNQAMLLGHALGLAPERLARLYGSLQGRGDATD